MGTEEVSDVTMNEPQLTEKLGTSQTILKMFLEKTNTFYRCFLDRLYAVADLLTDRTQSLLTLITRPNDHIRSIWSALASSACRANQPGPRSGLLNTSSSAGEENSAKLLNA